MIAQVRTHSPIVLRIHLLQPILQQHPHQESTFVRPVFAASTDSLRCRDIERIPIADDFYYCDCQSLGRQNAMHRLHVLNSAKMSQYGV
ncbi:MAG: hypothetical protein MUE44_32690 [Oscillatoriaceae cyanobacterium Prado104]|nr:hypothetical protein [Oscillatoriaceae cyanobacterium Prado104]